MSHAKHRYKPRRRGSLDTCERCKAQRKYHPRRSSWLYRTGPGSPWTGKRPACIRVTPADALPFVAPRGLPLVAVPAVPVGTRIIHVATLVIYGVGEAGHPHGQRGTCLYSLRPDDVLRPNLWENPGGKVDPGETVEEAGIREGVEELGVVTEVDAVLTTVAMDWVTHVIVLTALAAHIMPGQPTPRALASKELRWVDPQHAIERLPCSPGTYPIHRSVMSWMEKLR